MIPQPRTLFENRVASYSLSEQAKVSAIISSVFEAAGIKNVDMGKLQIRSRWLLEPTQVSMYILYCNTKLSLTETSVMLGSYRDHTTILNSIKKIQNYLDAKDISVCSIYNKAKKILRDDYGIELTDKKYGELIGKNKHTITYKQIEQLTIDGELIATFPSIVEAGKEVNMKPQNISNACQQGHITAGFRWRYKGDKTFVYRKPKQKHAWMIVQSDINNNEVEIFQNVTKAGKKLGIKARTIKRAVEDKSSLKGFWFERKFLPCK